MPGLLLLFPPVVALGIFLYIRNDKVPATRVLLLYGAFTLSVNLVSLMFVWLFLGGGDYVLSPDRITISFAVKYLLLSSFIAVLTAIAAHFLSKLFGDRRDDLVFRVEIQKAKKKPALSSVMFLTGVTTAVFQIGYIVITIGKRSLSAYLIHIPKAMPLKSNEIINLSTLLRHFVTPTLVAVVCVTAAYLLYCRFTRVNLSATCTSKLSGREIRLIPLQPKLYRNIRRAVYVVIAVLFLYIGFLFYLTAGGAVPGTNAVTGKRAGSGTGNSTGAEAGTISVARLPDWVAATNGLIAHALGGYDGHEYLNSVEALYYNYDNGLRVFEMDLCLTSDKVLVGVHDWNYWGYGGAAPTYDVFMGKQHLDKYTPASFRDAAEFLYNHPDAYIVTDKIQSGDELAFAGIFDACNALDPKMLDRIVVQVFNQTGYYEVTDKYPQFSVIYTLYGSTDTDAEVLRFVERTGIDAVTVWYERATPEFVRELNRRGAVVFAHTVNSPEVFGALRSAGVYGVYTDYLNHDDIGGFYGY